MRNTVDLTNQLKGICRLPGVAWAAWLVLEDSTWGMMSSHGFTRDQELQWVEDLRSPAMQKRISDAIVSGRPGWKFIPDSSDGALSSHAYVLPDSTGNRVLMIGIVEGGDSHEHLPQVQNGISSIMEAPTANPETDPSRNSLAREFPAEESQWDGCDPCPIEDSVRQMEEWIAQTAGKARVMLFVEKDGRTCCVGRAGELPVGKADDENVVILPMTRIAPWKGRWTVVFSEPVAAPPQDWMEAAQAQGESHRSVVMEWLLRKALDLETDARQMLENRLEHATRLISLGELAAGVSHEMVSPLATISGFLRMALEDIDPQSPVYDDLTLSLQESDRLRDLVGRMLDLARVPDRIFRSVDVNDLTRDVLALTFPSMRMAGVKVDTELQNDLATIEAEPASLKQVMINLIQNAIQAMPDGGSIRIHTGEGERCDQKGIVWQIIDNGPGIQPESLPKIFEPFFTTKPRGAGTGLGLAIVRSIVQTCGGEIEVATTVNQGTAFTIWLPIMKDSGGQIV